MVNPFPRSKIIDCSSGLIRPTIPEIVAIKFQLVPLEETQTILGNSIGAF